MATRVCKHNHSPHRSLRDNSSLTWPLTFGADFMGTVAPFASDWKNTLNLWKILVILHYMDKSTQLTTQFGQRRQHRVGFYKLCARYLVPWSVSLHDRVSKRRMGGVFSYQAPSQFGFRWQTPTLLLTLRSKCVYIPLQHACDLHFLSSHSYCLHSLCFLLFPCARFLFSLCLIVAVFSSKHWHLYLTLYSSLRQLLVWFGTT